MDSYSRHLLAWYDKNKRELPWRDTKDPYKIWLSEIILQQTRVAQGLNYYLAFIDNYPTISHLAAASEHEVLKLWQGLGYYSRARNMHTAARYIKEEFNGRFPRDYESIRALKGVGDYTAAAIASFAYNLPYPVLDGNVMRVYSRFLGIKEPINSSEGRKKLQKAAAELLPKEAPGAYNQAIMELGALCCLPKKPDCKSCPLQSSCYAYAHHLTAKLPVKTVKAKPRDRYLNYLVVKNGHKLVLRKRLEKDIWQGLHDFPCIETLKPTNPVKLTKSAQWQAFFGKIKPVIEPVSAPYTHILSHQKLHTNFISIKLNKPLKKLPANCFWIKQGEIEEYAVPRLIESYISKTFEL